MKTRDDIDEDANAGFDATVLGVANGGFYTLEKGKLSKYHSMKLKGWQWIACIFVIYMIAQLIIYGIQFTTSVEGMSSVATSIVENLAIIYIFPYFTIYIAFLIMMVIPAIIILGAVHWHWHLRVKTIVLICAISFVTYIFYYFMANAADATTVLVTSPSDPYLARYYVGATYIGEVYGTDILLFWLLPIAFGAIDAILIHAMHKEMKMTRKFDGNVANNSFEKEITETKHFTCTLIDNKGMCEFHE